MGGKKPQFFFFMEHFTVVNMARPHPIFLNVKKWSHALTPSIEMTGKFLQKKMTDKH